MLQGFSSEISILIAARKLAWVETMSSYLDEPPSTRPSTLMGCMHGWLLSNVLSFLDLDTLASCAVSCQDWYR